MIFLLHVLSILAVAGIDSPQVTWCFLFCIILYLWFLSASPQSSKTDSPHWDSVFICSKPFLIIDMKKQLYIAECSDISERVGISARHPHECLDLMTFFKNMIPVFLNDNRAYCVFKFSGNLVFGMPSSFHWFDLCKFYMLSLRFLSHAQYNSRY